MALEYFAQGQVAVTAFEDALLLERQLDFLEAIERVLGLQRVFVEVRLEDFQALFATGVMLVTPSLNSRAWMNL